MDSQSGTQIDLNKTPLQLEVERYLLQPMTAPMPNYINAIPISPQPFGCTACNRTFRNPYALAGHYNAHRGTRVSTRKLAAAKQRVRAEKSACFKLPVAAPPLVKRPLVIAQMSSANYRLEMEKQQQQAAQRAKLMGAFKPLAILMNDDDANSSATPLASLFGGFPPRASKVGGGTISGVPPPPAGF